MAYEHKIGTTVETLALLSALTTPVPTPKSDFRAYSVVKIAVSGRPIGIGAAEADWEWTYLTMPQRDQLRVFIAGLSADLVVRLLTNEGSYANYSVIAHWPDEEQRSSLYTFNFKLRFTHLTLIPEGD